MGSRRRRWLALGLALLAAAVGAACLARPLARQRVERALTARGCRAEGLTWRGAEMAFRGIVCPGIRLGEAQLRPWPRALLLRDLDVDLAAWLPVLRGGGDGGNAGGDGLVELAGLMADARVEDLDLRLGDQALAEDLSGTLGPLRLEGPGTLLEQRGAGYHLELRRALATGHLGGNVSAVLDWDVESGAIRGTLEGEALTLAHPLLASTPLGGLALHARIEGDDGDLQRPRLAGTLGLGGPEALWEARIEEQGLPGLLLELPDAEAAAWLAPLSPLVPELEHAELRGALGGSLRWTAGQPLSIAPRFGDLAVTGALPRDLDLAWGPFTYTVADADGERVPRRSGEGTAGWTPLSEVSPDLIHALLAAEDSAFYQHHGYDPAALQEALDADLAAGAVQRGGSTLTQQLAKNLFLDGEQTLARKLRELLLAVELDRTLGKERVLELYLNAVEFGPGLHGVGAACERFFMKRPARLDPLEAAFLVALLPDPRGGYRRWYLEGRPNRAKLDGILDNMVAGGWLGAAEAGRWKRARLALVPPPQ